MSLELRLHQSPALLPSVQLDGQSGTSPLLPRTPSAAWPWVAGGALSSFFLETAALPWVRATYLGPDSQPSSLQFPSSQAGLCSKLRRTPKSHTVTPSRSMPGSWLSHAWIMMLVWVKLFVYLAPGHFNSYFSPHLIVPFSLQDKHCLCQLHPSWNDGADGFLVCSSRMWHCVSDQSAAVVQIY